MIAAANQFRTFVFADIDITQVGVKLFLVDGRPHLHRFIQPVADFQFRGALHVAIHKLFINALLHNDAAGGGAALAGGTEAAPEAAFNGEVEIGIIEHDHRILAAQFERAVLKTFRRNAADDAAHRRRSGQRNSTHVDMLRQRRADVGTKSADDVDDSFRESGIGKSANKIKRRQRRILSGLDDAGVAADDCGKKFPRRNRHGKIPRRDHAADADGLAHGHGKLVRHFRRHGGTEQATAFARIVISGVNRFLHVAPRFGENLAHFAGHFAGIVFLTLNQNLGSAKNNLRATRSGNQAPLGEGPLGGFDGSIHVGPGGFLKNADQVAGVGRIAILKCLPRGSLDPFPVDKILENFCLAVGRRRGRDNRIGGHDYSL